MDIPEENGLAGSEANLEISLLAWLNLCLGVR